METTNGIKVYVSRCGTEWHQLNGYAGGLQLGMSSSMSETDTDPDGVSRGVKGNSAGPSSQLSFREIAGDAGQEIALLLGSHDHDGAGFVRTVRPSGVTTTAEGLFLSAMPNPYDPGVYIGYTVAFTQTEKESVT